jgi:hypothetical protein
MRFLLSLFCKYANSNVDRFKKANGIWDTITSFDQEDIYLGQKRWAWSTLLEYFIDIDLNESLG